MGKVNIDFTPTKYNADDAPDLVTGAYNQSMDDLKVALDNATAEDGGTSIDVPVSIENGGTGANNASDAAKNLSFVKYHLFGNAAHSDNSVNDMIRKIISDNNSAVEGQTIIGYGSAYRDNDGNFAGVSPTIIITRVNSTIWSGVIYSYFPCIDGSLKDGITYLKVTNGGDTINLFPMAKLTDLANYLPLTGGTVTGALTLNTALGISSGGTGANTAEQARENLGIVDPTPVYVETDETSEPGLHIIVDSENNVLKIKKV